MSKPFFKPPTKQQAAPRKGHKGKKKSILSKIAWEDDEEDIKKPSVIKQQPSQPNAFIKKTNNPNPYTNHTPSNPYIKPKTTVTNPLIVQTPT